MERIGRRDSVAKHINILRRDGTWHISAHDNGRFRIKSGIKIERATNSDDMQFGWVCEISLRYIEKYNMGEVRVLSECKKLSDYIFSIASPLLFTSTIFDA